MRRVSEHRGALPEIPGEGTAEYLSTRYSHALWQVRELIERRGYDGARSVLERNNAEPPLTLQTNTLRTTAEELADMLRAAGFEPVAGASAGEPGAAARAGQTCRRVTVRGLFLSRDGAARLAVRESGVKLGMTVLDACAAPGGKSFGAAIQMNGAGRIISCDVQEKKLRRISDGAARLGLNCIETRRMDARRPAEELIGAADVVIADAPCSGLGVIAKKPEIRFKSESDLEALPGI